MLVFKVVSIPTREDFGQLPLTCESEDNFIIEQNGQPNSSKLADRIPAICMILILFEQVKVTTPDDRPAENVRVNIQIPRNYINQTLTYNKNYMSDRNGNVYVTIPPYLSTSIVIEVRNLNP